MRTATVNRKTNETDISLSINLDGTGKSEINTSCPFLDHMLTLFACHSGFDLSVKCTGDIEVDYHHTVEDIGIALGLALFEAIGDKKGIVRYGDTTLPMDESLILSAVDVSGRSYLAFDLDIPAFKVGNFDTELVEEFFVALVNNAKITLHIRQLAGKNSHHIIEGTFKSVAHTFKKAFSINGDAILSTKGVL